MSEVRCLPFAVLCRPGCRFANCVMVHGALVFDYRGLDSLVRGRPMWWWVRSCFHLETSSSVVMAVVWCSCVALPCAATCRNVRVMGSVGSCVMDDLHCDSFLMMTAVRTARLRCLPRPMLNTRIHWRHRKSCRARRELRTSVTHNGRR